MDISNLRERLILQTSAYKYDQLGGYTISWVDCGTFWAEIIPINASRNKNDVNIDFDSNQYQVRWRASLRLPKSPRFLWGEKILNLMTPIQTDERKRWSSTLVKMGSSNE